MGPGEGGSSQITHGVWCRLTRVVAESDSSVVVRQGTEVFGLDLNHGGPGERHVVLHEGLSHGLLHHQVDIRHLHKGSQQARHSPLVDGNSPLGLELGLG